MGETFTFRPVYNVPALAPTTTIDGIMKNDYYLKICVGRAHNFVIASLKVVVVSAVVKLRLFRFLLSSFPSSLRPSLVADPVLLKVRRRSESIMLISRASDRFHDSNRP